MNKNLSTCEAQIMKVIWDQEEKISTPQLINLFQERYKKELQPVNDCDIFEAPNQ